MAAHSHRLRAAFLAAILLLILPAFQNCSQGKFDTADDNLASLGDIKLNNLTIHTKKNQSIDFTLGTEGGKGGELSFSTRPGTRSLTTANGGKFEILDARNYRVRYTPGPSFVGDETVAAHLADSYGNSRSAQVTAVVGNIISHLQPALAVRAMGCIACHAKVASNVVTDFGFGTASFFGNADMSRWKNSFYGDHGQNFKTMELLNNAKVIVPVAPIPADKRDLMSANSLKAYLDGQMAASSHAGTKATSAQEMSKVEIKIPNAGRLKRVFSSTPAPFLYEKDTQHSPDLQGLSFDAGKRLFTVQNLVCDGDLYLDGVVWFKGARIQSVNGCRIYATESVFISDGMTSLAFNSSAGHNIQILSSRSIWMGIGSMSKNSTYCESAGWMKDHEAASSMEVRLRYLVNYLASTREYPDPSGLKARVEADIGRLGAPLYDATCESGGREKSFDRVLLAAPWVNSRYKGNVRGAVIAEVALAALGSFVFEFHPVFKTTSVLPKLNDNEIINIQ